MTFLEYLGRFTVVVVLVLWVLEGPARERLRIRAAWDLVYQAAGNGGEGAKAAIEELVVADQELSRLNLDGAILLGANLRGANLADARMNGANLFEANLSGARLFHADLRGANLGKVKLSGAKLYEANLSGAILTEAILTKADLKAAWVSPDTTPPTDPPPDWWDELLKSAYEDVAEAVAGGREPPTGWENFETWDWPEPADSGE
jgi:hypothetical protein